MKLSLSGFLFEDDYKMQSLPFADFAELAKDYGYAGVELRNTQVSIHIPGEVVSEYRSILNDYGLCVTCMTPRGLPIEMQERNELFLRYLELAGQMDCKLLKISGEPQWLRHAADLAQKRGIMLATNTHLNSPTETVAGTRTLLKEIEHPNYGLLYDPMHLAIAGEDYLGAIEIFYPRICNVLVQSVRLAEQGENPVISHNEKDYIKTFIDETPIQDWPAIFRKLKQTGYDGWITVIENAWPLEQRETVALRTAEYIRDMW